MALIPVPTVVSVNHHSDEISNFRGNYYFYEYNGTIINLSFASKFYIDHFPCTDSYTPYAKIGGNTYQLHDSFKSNDEAFEFIRGLVKQMK